MKFETAAKFLSAEIFIEMAKAGEIDMPEKMSDIICLVGRVGLSDLNDKPDGAAIDKIRSAIRSRLATTINDGWLYKSQIIDQLNRRKFFRAACKELKIDKQSMFLNALADMAGEIEHSEDGKQIRLKPEVSSAPSFTADCPDMDF